MGGVLLAVAAGIAIAVQVALVGRAADRASALALTMWVQLGGAAAALAIIAVRGRIADVGDSGVLAWAWLPAGVCGTIIVSALATATTQVGLATALSVSVAVQLAASTLWDHNQGLLERPLQALAGVALLSAGAVVVATARA